MAERLQPGQETSFSENSIRAFGHPLEWACSGLHRPGVIEPFLFRNETEQIMKTSYSSYLLLSVGVAIAVSQACGEWNDDTVKRYEIGEKTMCRVIGEMAKDRDAECDSYVNETLRRECKNKWNEIVNGARLKKLEAATAFMACDSEALDQISDWFGKLSDMVNAIGGITFNSGPIENEFTFIDESAMAQLQVSAHGPAGTFGSSNYTVTSSMGGSQQQLLPRWKIRWDPTLTDEGTLQSNFSMDTSNLNQGPVRQSIPLLSGLLTLDNPLSGADTFELDTSRPSSFLVQWNGASWSGHILAYFIFNNGGFWAMRLPASIAANGRLDIDTLGLKPMNVVFPVEPENAPPAIYSFSLAGDLQIGSTNGLHAEGVDPLSGMAVWVATTFNNGLGVTFNGFPWDLNVATQVHYGNTVANSDGVISMPVVVPNDPAFIGQMFCFQGIGIVGGSWLRTGSTTSVVQF